MNEKLLKFVNKDINLFKNAFFIGEYNSAKIYILFPINKNLQISFIAENKEGDFFIPNGCCRTYFFTTKYNEIQALSNKVYE